MFVVVIRLDDEHGARGVRAQRRGISGIRHIYATAWRTDHTTARSASLRGCRGAAKSPWTGRNIFTREYLIVERERDQVHRTILHSVRLVLEEPCDERNGEHHGGDGNDDGDDEWW